jgi:hypothetical protein
MKYTIKTSYNNLECIWVAEIQETMNCAWGNTRVEAIQEVCENHYMWDRKGDTND